TIEWVKRQNWLLDIAVDTLTLARARLGLALEHILLKQSVTKERDNVRVALAFFDESVFRLSAAGHVEFAPYGFLGRAAFHRSIGDWGRAGRDLGEVEEIAEPGPMKLFLCDLALERARVALARREGFAPLRELMDYPPAAPVLLTEPERKNLRDEAAKQL